ncbi:hypothetical protein LPE509_p00051 (plasmid) [Legionella pneumophila subsp. pneumophila LPE509]|nr:hypothetical protein LPE509_p00051 [Legionella pneumophila subsp. pneumophila LPE509]
MDMNTFFDSSNLFINYVLENTSHNIYSLSEILAIPIKRLSSLDKLTKYDLIKIDSLKKLLEKNC